MGGFDITSNWITSQRNIVFEIKLRARDEGEVLPLFNEY